MDSLTDLLMNVLLMSALLMIVLFSFFLVIFVNDLLDTHVYSPLLLPESCSDK